MIHDVSAHLDTLCPVSFVYSNFLTLVDHPTSEVLAEGAILNMPKPLSCEMNLRV